MRPIPTCWKVLVAVLALTFMVGCQGFSTAKTASQGTSPSSATGDLSTAPASISFGNVPVGTSQTQSDTLTNTGGTSINLTQAAASGAGFSTTGLNLPLALAPGQSVTFSVIFSPQAVGSASGTIAVTNDGTVSPLNIAVSGTAVAAGSLVTNPSSFIWSNVQVGTAQPQTENLKNSGSENVTILQATTTAAAFTYTGLSLPLTLAPNQSTTFGVVFTPTNANPVNGSLSMTLSGSSTTVDIALSGTGATLAALVALPGSLTFTGGTVGKVQTQSETIQNTGGGNATISQASVSGAGFNISGLSTPLTLIPGQSASFNVTFTPPSTGNFGGSIALLSNASDPSIAIPLSGSTTGSTLGQLSVSPATINTGNVTVGKSGTQKGTLSATGGSVVVTSVSIGSTEFTVSGLSFPATIPAGQSVNFVVTFTPLASGLASVSASFASDASNSPASATFQGTGVAAAIYTVSLSWNPSTSPNVTGYNIYRRTGTSGGYTKINTAVNSATSYVDTSVTDGLTYYYETTAVNSSGEESAPSAAVQAVIPAP
jgi:Abnormal spindle-like microcephaly-assoc'd, ASPM-SPD-2-Hydin